MSLFTKNPLENSTIFGELFTTISQQQVVELHYHRFDTPDEDRQLIVHPYILKEYNRRWYLIAAADNDGKLLNFALLKYMKRWYAFYSERVVICSQDGDEFGAALVSKTGDKQNVTIRQQVADELQDLIRQQPADELGPKVGSRLEMPEIFGRIPWFHHVHIISKCQSLEEALFYINRIAEEGWSRSRLEAQVAANLFGNQGAAITNFEHTLPTLQSQLAKEILKVSSNVATNLGTNDACNTLIDSANSANNIGTSKTNVATGSPNVATDLLAENKRVVDEIVKKRVHSKMSPQQIKECIIEACVVEHSIDELAKLLNKTPGHLRNRFIPELVADGILLPTKPRHSPGQTYMTNPKLDK